MNETDDQQNCDTCERTSGRTPYTVFCDLIGEWVNTHDVACADYCGTKKERDNGQ